MTVSCSGDGCAHRAVLRRPKTGHALCRACFFAAFEAEIHDTITAGDGLFSRGQLVAIAASGGKDSTVLAHVLSLLNQRHDYGLRLMLLSIDEGISGYRDDSLRTVQRNSVQYNLPLTVLSYEQLYGWTMDAIVRSVGRRSNCTFCGVLRRQALDRGARLLRVDHLVTGHNADDLAETVLMNVLRGDVARLRRCTDLATRRRADTPDTAVSVSAAVCHAPARSKPLKYAYEKEIVMYAHFKRLDYFSTECVYSPLAYRGHVRTLLKQLEAARPAAILDLLRAGESVQLAAETQRRLPTLAECGRCGHASSQPVCKACVLLAGLNQGRPRLAVGKGAARLVDRGGDGCCGGGGGCGGGRPSKCALNGAQVANNVQAESSRDQTNSGDVHRLDETGHEQQKRQQSHEQEITSYNGVSR